MKKTVIIRFFGGDVAEATEVVFYHDFHRNCAMVTFWEEAEARQQRVPVAQIQSISAE